MRTVRIDDAGSKWVPPAGRLCGYPVVGGLEDLVGFLQGLARPRKRVTRRGVQP